MKIQRIPSLFVNLYRRYFQDAPTARFISHNLRVWRSHCISSDSKAEILVEQTGDASSVIACSYLANVLAARHKAKLVAYRFDWSRKLYWLNKLLVPVRDKIFSSFNFKSFLRVDPSIKQLERAESIFGEVYPTLKEKRDVESLTIHGVWIGDLVYDEYLRQNWDATIDLRDNVFIESLKRSLSFFVFWEDYLERNVVKAVCLSHCVYKLAILLRLAVRQSIPVYQVNATHVYHLTDDNMFAYTDFYYYREVFASLPKDIKEIGIGEAKNRIERRFAGEVGIDMPYSKKSSYSEKKNHRVLRVSDRKKILIATHSFSDSPHGYGVSLFPDFYEWLEYLGKMSERTDYDWYLKMHPDYFPEDAEVISKFIEKYPKITLLPSDTSHHQLIEEGIGFLLTVHGTIGFEYAALGVPVINASACNPHVAYNFNLHPKTVEEYEQILLNLDSQKLLINPEDVYEYYFMKNLYYSSEDWLFDSYKNMMNRLGGYNQQFSSAVYDVFLEEFSPTKHEKILQTLEHFVESGAFQLMSAHTLRAT